MVDMSCKPISIFRTFAKTYMILYDIWYDVWYYIMSDVVTLDMWFMLCDKKYSGPHQSIGLVVRFSNTLEFSGMCDWMYCGLHVLAIS